MQDSWKWAQDYDCPTFRCKYGGRERVAYTSSNTPRLLSSEVPRTVKKRREKVTARDKHIKQKELATRTAFYQDSAKSQPRSRFVETIAPSVLMVIWMQQPQQGDRQKKRRDKTRNRPQQPHKIKGKC